MSIDSVRKRLEAATPGPWWIGPSRRGFEMHIGAGAFDEYAHGSRWPAVHGGTYVVSPGREGDGGIDDTANADLIAHAPTDLAALLKVAEAAQAYVAFLANNGGFPKQVPRELISALEAVETLP